MLLARGKPLHKLVNGAGLVASGFVAGDELKVHDPIIRAERRIGEERPKISEDVSRKIWQVKPYGLSCHGGRRIKATLLFHQRIDYDDGAIVEMVLWRVPSPVPPSGHGLKYSLFYGRPGGREIGYDNEHGKGDHRHFQGVETIYTFSTVERLIADFWSDVRRLREVQ